MQKSLAMVKEDSATEAQKIAAVMARLGISALPRNYELVHEAIGGRNTELARDFSALGSSPRQAQLDELGFQYRLATHCGVAVARAQADAGELFRRLNEQLTIGLSHKRSFVRALEMTGRSLREEKSSIAESLAAIDFLSGALTQLLTSETALGKTLGEGAEKIERLERGFGAVEATVLRDKLTHLPNRIAFANRLEQLYADGVSPERTALIIADIDDFGQINAKFGQQAGNRLLKRLATVFRKSVKKNDYVARVGGDDFAFLFRDVEQADAMAIAERLRATIEENLVFATSDDKDPDRLTVSIGVAMSSAAATTAQLQAQAESALASAKANRRAPIRIAERQRALRPS